MVEFIGVALALGPKLMKLGQAAWEAHDDQADWKAGLEVVSALADTVATARGLPRGDKAAELVATHGAMVVSAFTAAWHQHWVNHRATLKKHKADAEASVRTALERLVPAPTGADGRAHLAHFEQLRRDPTSAEVYQTLWALFAADALIHQADEPQTGQQFRRDFYRAWSTLRASAVGAPLRAALDSEDHARAVREHLAWDFVGWGQRHVFGNLRAHPELHAMPLDAVYVEPACAPEGRHENAWPIQAKLGSWLEDRPAVAVVQANFGHGKSLSARRFATDLATTWLAAPAPAEAWWPVFVRCVQHYDDRLEAMVRVAQRDQLGEAGGPHLDADDPVLALPDATAQRVVIILDGLDEVHLEPGRLKALFTQLERKTSDRRRIVVFSRPGAVQGLDEKVRRFELQSFSPNQVGQWLDGWRALLATWPGDQAERLAITAEALEARGLAELAGTPILLFMIAWTWQREAVAGSDVVDVYDRFFKQLARSKCEYDPEHGRGHPALLEAARELRDGLIKRGLLAEGAEAATALLWFLGRVAWEHARHAHQDRPLIQRHVENLIESELGLETGPTFELIKKGLMLVLQVEPAGEKWVVEFGHRSFREYLVATFWCARLTKERFEARDEAALLGARLLVADSKALGFLLALVQRSGQAAEVAARAAGLFNDERLARVEKDPSLPRDVCLPREDQRLYLREAALALRCHLDQTPFRPEEGAVRSLAGLFYAQGDLVQLDAPRLVLENMNLSGILLAQARLGGADLRGAVLWGADLQGADLEGADLRGADLWEATFWDAGIRGADLRGADLRGADLEGADLEGANLEGADLWEADLGGANLVGANLQGADLQGADLGGANLRGANLGGAHLGAGPGQVRVRGLHLARNLEHAHMPEGFALADWPQDDDEDAEVPVPLDDAEAGE